MREAKNSLGKRLTFIIVLFSVVLAFAVAAIGYNIYVTNIIKRFEEYSISTLNIAVQYLIPDVIEESIKTGEFDQTYGLSQSLLNDVKENSKIKYLYLFDILENKTDTKNIVYYISATTPGEVLEGKQFKTLGDTDYLPEDLINQLEEAKKNPWEIVKITNTSMNGHVMSLYLPVADTTGKVVGIMASEVAMEDINLVLVDYVTKVAIGGIAVLTVFMSVILLTINKQVSKPITLLAEKASGFIENEKNVLEMKPIEVNVKTNDEIATLASSLHQLTSNLIDYIVNLQITVANKERIERDLKVAKEIQESILPNEFPPFPDKKEIDIYASMIAAKDVGGDFYDFFFIDEKRLAFIVADVSGKGVPAALFMMVARTIIQNQALTGSMSPGEILQNANNQLCANNRTDLFVTAILFILDIETGHLQYANAGHNPPIIIQKGKEAQWVNTKPAFVLAGMEDINYTTQDIMLSHGDVILLYTDGVTESFDKLENLFSDERLINLARGLSEEQKDPEKLVSFINKAVFDFSEGVDQADDITVLAMRWN